METISAIRFSFTRKGELRAELTLVGEDGVRRFPRIVNAAATIAAAATAGADVRGYKREITLHNAEALAANGGNPFVSVAEYATATVRCNLTLLGDYVEVATASVKLVGPTAADNAAVRELVAGVQLTATAARAAAKPTGDDNDLA